ncbi:MAG: hypothetical protein K2H29_12310 [Oscillospiraceae bacterium]|nr:hypothetical protein [Oscillospiraceae bacterium]
MTDKTGYKKTVYPVTSLDQIGLSPDMATCARCYGIYTAEELAKSVSNPLSLWNKKNRAICRKHLLEHGYLSEEGINMENKKYFQVSYEVGNTYSSNIAIAECVDDVVDYYKAEGHKGVGVSSITKEEAEASIRRHPGKPVIEIPKQERRKPSVPFEPEVTVISAEASYADKLVDSGLEMIKTGVGTLCSGVKLMHDGKLYKQFGFQNFEEYCQSKGFSDRYGRDLIKIANMLEQEKNRNSSSGFENLGVTVLKLLAGLAPEQREEIIQTVDIQNTSTRDMEKKVKELKNKVRMLEQDKSRMVTELNQTEQELIESRAREKHLHRENQELKNQPSQIEYMQSVEELQRIEELEGQNELITNEYNELDEENKQLRADLQEALAKAQEILDDSAEATEELEQLREENAMLEKQLSERSSHEAQRAELNAYMKMLDKTMMHICGFILRHKHTPEANNYIDNLEHVIERYLTPLKEGK